jgi:hypothetical protein
MRFSEVWDITNMTLAICMQTFGVNPRRKHKISVAIEQSHKDGDAFGQYESDTNTIYIYLDYVKNVEMLVSTIVHEYIHSLQPIPSKYDKLLKEYKYYSRHPHERQAVYYEKKYSRPIWNIVNQAL